MSELDEFEGRFSRALRRYEAEISTEFDAWRVAQMAAAANQRQITWPWRFAPARAFVWIVLAGLLLAALFATSLVIGSLRTSTGLACPLGTSPDAAGPATQARPPWTYSQPMAFDRRAGRIVAYAIDTWTFDVCTNTWAAMYPTVEPSGWANSLVYDANRDLTLTIAGGRVWAYDLSANTWTRKSMTPALGDFPHMVYDPVSGLVFVLPMDAVGDQLQMWTYDVEDDTWTRVDSTGAPPSLSRHFMAYDSLVDRIVIYEETLHTWLFDPRGHVWTRSSERAPDLGFDWAVTGGEMAYDEAASQSIATSGGKVIAYDAVADHWQTLRDDRTVENACVGPTCLGRPTVVYDSVNRRVVAYGSEYPVGNGEWIQGSAVLTFDPAAATWTTLLEGPSTFPSPRPGE